MHKLRIAAVSFWAIFSSSAIAAPISVGPYLLDDSASATSATFSGTVYQNVSGAITDDLENTYIKGTSADAGVTLGFGDIALSNQADDDLALFFISADNTVTVNLNGETGTYTSQQLFVNPDNPFVDIGDKYMVENIFLPNNTFGTADLSVIFVDLEDFNIGLNQSISSIDILIGNNQSLMTYAVGTHVSAVPLPAAAWLFITGLGALGFISRRRV